MTALGGLKQPLQPHDFFPSLAPKKPRRQSPSEIMAGFLARAVPKQGA